MKIIWSAIIPRKGISLNGAYATNWKTGRRFISKEAKDLKDFIAEFVGYTYHGKITTKPLIEYLTFTFKGNYRRDIDNLPKLVNDSLSKRIFKDDSQIQELHLKKQIGDKEQIEIKIYEI